KGRIENSTDMRDPSLRIAGTASMSFALYRVRPVRIVSAYPAQCRKLRLQGRSRPVSAPNTRTERESPAIQGQIAPTLDSKLSARAVEPVAQGETDTPAVRREREEAWGGIGLIIPNAGQGCGLGLTRPQQF